MTDDDQPKSNRETGLCILDKTHEGPFVDRLCVLCYLKYALKLGTHIGVICKGCGSRSWIIRTPDNVKIAAVFLGLRYEDALGSSIIHEVGQCNRCLAMVRDFTREAKFEVSH